MSNMILLIFMTSSSEIQSRIEAPFAFSLALARGASLLSSRKHNNHALSLFNISRIENFRSIFGIIINRVTLVVNYININHLAVPNFGAIRFCGF